LIVSNDADTSGDDGVPAKKMRGVLDKSYTLSAAIAHPAAMLPNMKATTQTSAVTRSVIKLQDVNAGTMSSTLKARNWRKSGEELQVLEKVVQQLQVKNAIRSAMWKDKDELEVLEKVFQENQGKKISKLQYMVLSPMFGTHSAPMRGNTLTFIDSYAPSRIQRRCSIISTHGCVLQSCAC
jgi:hypothetical protein